jgi:NAD(P)-dependent dehydrogenase (short-subunit alcohol dehydrogenase family)
MSLRDTVVVVTGASRGIGRAIAERAAADGARLVLCARSAGPLRETARVLSKNVEVLAVPADASREDEVERLRDEALTRFGRVDAVVNNAGSAESAPFLKTERAFWDRMLAENATSAFLVSRAFVGGMAERGNGRIVMVASVSAKKGAPYVAAYTASKHAMLGLMKSLAAEFGPKGVKVNAVCPGYVDTPMTDRSVKNVAAKTGRSAADARRAMEEMNPQKRFLKPEEVAAAVLPLLDPACAKNGEAIDL